LTVSDRNAVATQLQGEYQQLLGLANTSQNGEYLFSGFKGNTQAFSEISPGVVVYNGDQGQRTMQIAAGRQVPVSSAGVDVFQRIANGNGTFVTSPGTAGSVTGSAPVGTLVITAANNTLNVNIDGAAATVTIPPATYATRTTLASAIQTAINSSPTMLAAGKTVSVTANAAGVLTMMSTSSGATSTVTAPTGTAAANLFGGAPVVTAGTSNTGTGVIGPGSVVDPTKWNTVGNTQNYKIVFAQDTSVQPPVTTYDIVTNVQTVVNGVTYNAGDSLLTGAPSVQVASASGGPNYPRTYTEGQTISFKTQPGDTNPNPAWDLGIEAVVSAFPTSNPTTATPAVPDSFTVKASTNNQDIFKTVYSLISALQSGSGTDLSNAAKATLANLDHADNSVLTATANVGVSLAEVDTYKTNNDNTVVNDKTAISGLQDLDVAKAASDLALKQAALDASEKSFITVSGLSLFNFINP
jgi:flagellin-like hook-associated protein FlgL